MQDCLHIGIDAGSKTVKLVILDEDEKLLFSIYRRHLTNIRATIRDALHDVPRRFLELPATITVTGSAGMQLAQLLGLPFVQEVVATKCAIERLIPQTDVAIELGGEDSKILYLTGGEELRMNSTCAGGTGGFIDTLAGMLDTNAEGLSRLAYGGMNIYPIASRCAVFAQMDVRPLLNEGASKADIALSVLNAVVTQCIGGLACGRPIRGKVAFLGGPLHFLSALVNQFMRALDIARNDCIRPTDSHLFVAKGAAFVGQRRFNHDSKPARCTSEPNTQVPHVGVRENASALETLAQFMSRVDALDEASEPPAGRLPALFSSPEEYDVFKKRHAAVKVERLPLARYTGEMYLGIDSGSTSMKCVLIGRDGELLYSYYKRSAGDIIAVAKKMFEDLYRWMPHNYDGSPLAYIAHATVTGYGEGLLKSAFMLDSGEVETMAHLRAAQRIVPDVDFILDIGGQDIKCMRVRNGVVNDVVLNEACSSGCGALISGFAHNMRLSLWSFTDKALFAPEPVDLGTRCTVFMTSRVRHAQKEGASAGDISAGLAYSVVKNALYKVIRVADARDLGRKIVVQGGTFKSDAVLRAFEQLCGREVVRPDISELAGAYGAALIARERAALAPEGTHSTMLGAREADALTFTQKATRCTQCSNACMLTINTFVQEETSKCAGDYWARVRSGSATRNAASWNETLDAGDAAGSAVVNGKAAVPQNKPRHFIMGNRCEKGAGAGSSKALAADIPNLVDARYRLLFERETSNTQQATRGRMGIPRALDMYEWFPFWHAFFTNLGYEVVLSHPSSRALFGKGIETIPSESACYPAKMTHGHVIDLVEQGVDAIFMPFVSREAHGELSCPVIASYPLALALNIETSQLLTPHLSMDCVLEGEPSAAFVDALETSLAEVPTCETPSLDELLAALHEAQEAQRVYRQELERQGHEALAHMRASGGRGIVLAMRPYHVDPEMHHAIPEMLMSYGLYVFTPENLVLDDEAANASNPAEKDTAAREIAGEESRWEYPRRVCRAAQMVAAQTDLALMELYSFGCGIDAVTTDQARAILESRGQIYTALKIDEMSDLGATRIRVRSMLAALKEHEECVTEQNAQDVAKDASEKSATHLRLLCPHWSPVHFGLLAAASAGSNCEFVALPVEGEDIVRSGLAYANNDLCYSSIFAVGQVIEALRKSPQTTHESAILLPSVCVSCRAGDLSTIVGRALDEAGFSHIPVVQLASLLGGSVGELLDAAYIERMAFALSLGDVLVQMLASTRPYESSRGAANKLLDEWQTRLRDALPLMDDDGFEQTVRAIIVSFMALIPAQLEQRKIIGLVGSLSAVYCAPINNHLMQLIEEEGCEVRMPYFSDYVLHALRSTTGKTQMQAMSFASDVSAATSTAPQTAGALLDSCLVRQRAVLATLMAPYPRLFAPVLFETLANKAWTLLSPDDIVGAGWLLGGQMMTCIEDGITDVVYVHSFACLCGHALGKGIIKELRYRYARANIVSIDCDPGTSEVNQVNRIKLMIAVALES